MKSNYLRWSVAATIILFAATIIVTVPFIRAQSSPEDPPSGSSLEERIEQRKSEQGISLDDSEITRLERRCTQVQSSIRQLQNPKISMLSDRDSTYEKISGKTWLSVGSIRLAQADTFNLKRHALDLDDKIEDFRKYTINYNQTIRDILQMNCASDVEGFMALIETLRHYDRTLLDIADSIRSKVNNDIRDELEALAGEV